MLKKIRENVGVDKKKCLRDIWMAPECLMKKHMIMHNMHVNFAQSLSREKIIWNVTSNRNIQLCLSLTNSCWILLKLLPSIIINCSYLIRSQTHSQATNKKWTLWFDEEIFISYFVFRRQPAKFFFSKKKLSHKSRSV